MSGEFIIFEAPIPLSLKGAVDGVAELDGTGKVPVAQLPDGVTAGLNYRGGWNATTNTSPALASGALVDAVLAAPGDFFIVTTGGSTLLDGISTWEIGDWVIANDTPAWERVNNASVNSVLARGGTGASDLFGDVAITTEHIHDLPVTSATVGDVLADAAVTGPKLAVNSVGTGNVIDGNVTTAKLAAAAVTADKLAADAVVTASIVDANVTTAKIADGAVTLVKLAADSVNAAKIVDNSVGTAELAAGAVTSTELALSAVTTTKIADLNVTAAKIANNTITATQIAAGTITATELAADSVTAAELADNAVDTASIVDLNVTTGKIAALAVTAAKIANNTITAAQIAAGTITATELAADSVTASELANDAVDTAAIVDLNVTTGKLADDAVTAAKLADNAVDTAAIVDDAVTAAKLAPGAVDAAAIAARSLAMSYSPQYPGATITRNGSGGSNAVVAAYDAAQLENFYGFTRTTADTAVTITVAWRLTLPWNFSAWQTNPFAVTIQTDTTTAGDNSVSVQLYDNAGTADTGMAFTDLASTVAGVQRTVTVTGPVTLGTYAAGDTVLLLFTLKSQSGNQARLYETTLNFDLQ